MKFKKNKILIKILPFILLLISCSATSSNSTEKAHEHSFSSAWTKDENYHWHLANCGHDLISDKAQHNFSDWKIRNDATCQEYGLEYRTCLTCEYEETRTNAKAAHSFSSWLYETDNEEQHYQICEDCGDKFYQDHNWVLDTNDPSYVANNCLQTGVDVYVCSGCHEKRVVSTDIGEHNLVNKYDETGHWKECLTCHDIFDFEAHDFTDSITYDPEPTHTSVGKEIKSCNGCEYCEENILNVTPYDFSKDLEGLQIINMTDNNSDMTWMEDSGWTRPNTQAFRFKMYGDSENKVDWQLTFPAVDFTYYQSLNASFKYVLWVTSYSTNGWYIGFNKADMDNKTYHEGQCQTGYHEGDFSVEYVDGVLYVGINFGDLLVKTTFTDSDIIHGLKGIPLYVSVAGSGDTFMEFNSFTLSRTCEHHYVSLTDPEVNPSICSACGKEGTLEAYDFTRSKVGADILVKSEDYADSKLWCINANKSMLIENKNTLTYKSYQADTWKWVLPKVNFNYYSSLTANVTLKAFDDPLIDLTFDETKTDSLTGISALFTNGAVEDGTLSVIKDGDSLNCTLIIGGQNITYTITDEDIIKGQKSIAIYEKEISGSDIYMYISDWTVNE